MTFLTFLKVIPDDPILDFVNSQCHSSEDLDQALQAYQAYQVPCPQDHTITPERSINHHFTYHIAQASQAKHGSLVDRGANGGFAGSCEDNEYACYGKGHTIHSSGQIEWFKNSVDDRSVQVGDKQRICTIDGYAMPFTCRGGLMYLSILEKNQLIKIWRDTQLCTFQDPMNGILLSWAIPTHLVMGSLLGPMTLMRDLPLIPTLMSLGITPKGQYKLLAFWMTLHPL